MSLCLPDVYSCGTKYRLPLQRKITNASLLCEDVDEFLPNPLNVHENETNNLSCLDKTIFYFEYIRTQEHQTDLIFAPIRKFLIEFSQNDFFWIQWIMTTSKSNMITRDILYLSIEMFFDVVGKKNFPLLFVG